MTRSSLRRGASAARRPWPFAGALAAITLLGASAVRAQGVPVDNAASGNAPNNTGASGAGTGAAGAAGGGGAAGGAAGQPTTFVPVFPGGVAPPPPGQVLGGGNVSSSANKPRTGSENDTFDLNRAEGSGPAVLRGSQDGPVFGGTSAVRTAGPATTPGVHIVRKGDTLWGICEQYFQNPYEWPRIWSYNPEIHNPHYIEVGQAVRLRSGTGGAATPAPPPGATGAFVARQNLVAPETIFLREQGFIEDEATETWGEITGAPEDKMFLADTDDVYIRLVPKRDVRVGQELTIFRPLRPVKKGQLIEILGTARVSSVNPQAGILKAKIVETLDVIERGARVGAIPRRFEVVAPVRSAKDLDATILTSLLRRTFYGQHQIVFIDKGSEDGLARGNTLRVTRRGDAWHASLPTEGAARRIDMESESAAAIERVPQPRGEEKFPDEVVAELRVISLQKHSALCVVTQSSREIEAGEVAHLRRGF